MSASPCALPILLQLSLLALLGTVVSHRPELLSEPGPQRHAGNLVVQGAIGETRKQLQQRLPEEGVAEDGAVASGLQAVEVFTSAHMRVMPTRHSRPQLHGSSPVDKAISGGSPSQPVAPDSYRHNSSFVAGNSMDGQVFQSASKVGASAEVITTGAASVAAAGAKTNRSIVLRGVNTVLKEDIEEKDILSLREHLAQIEEVLQEDSAAFDVNAPLHPRGYVLSELENLSQVPNLTLLGITAHQGWLPGMQAILEWDAGRKDSGRRLKVDGDALGTLIDWEAKEINEMNPFKAAATLAVTPLQLAVGNRQAEVVSLLVSHNASMAVRDANGMTPLEVATAGGLVEVVRSLLETPNSELSHGLLSLRLRLRTHARQLPNAAMRWYNSAPSDPIEDMLGFVQPGFRPMQDELAFVGRLPSAWVLLYTTRVMCKLANSRISAAELLAVERALAEHKFDGFAREYTSIVTAMALILGIVLVAVRAIFRLRLYGWMDTPISLAYDLPGAFDPTRIIDSDFDPARHKLKFPYRAVKEQVGHHPCSFSTVLKAFFKALFGFFSSWCFQCVRIPPEQDPYDEDYLSDDGDDDRARVRLGMAAKAHFIHHLEVGVRVILTAVIVWWLGAWWGRLGDVAVLVVLLYLHAFFSAAMAHSTMPDPAPEKASFSQEGSPGSWLNDATLDSALLVHAVFAPQHGPRWSRAICTARSTAAPLRSRLRRGRRRSGRAGNVAEAGSIHSLQQDEEDDETELLNSMGDTAGSSEQQDSSAAAFGSSFRRAFLRSGQMHIRQRALLVPTTLSLTVVVLVLIWLVHFRSLLGDSFLSFYRSREAAQLFRLYGGPGTLHRWAAVAFELLFLAMCGERIFGIASILHVADASLQQRARALCFVRRHPPPSLPSNITDEQERKRQAISRLDQCVRCSELALELSTLRWKMLRDAVLLVYLCVLKAFGGTLVFYLVFCAGFGGLSFDGLSVDPLVPLALALCLLFPLSSLLVTAAATNREAKLYWSTFLKSTEEAIPAVSSDGEGSSLDVQYVQLRVKATQMAFDSGICWPGGRQLGTLEPVVLLIFASTACGFAVACTM